MKDKRLLAVLLALAMLAAACGGSEADETTSDSDATPEVSTEEDTGAAASEPETEENDEDEAGDEAAAEEPEASETQDTAPLELGGPAAPGSYTSDLLGTPVTFALEEMWIAAAGDPGAVVFVDPESETDTSEVILVTRMNSLAGVGEATTEPLGPTMSGPADDLGAWIEAAGELLSDGPQSTTVGGYSTTTYDVTVDPVGSETIPGGCGPGPDDRCFFVGGTGSKSVAFFIVRTTELYRMWLVDQGDEAPLLITAIASAENQAWLDGRAETFVAGISLGDIAPHPVVIPENAPWEAGFPAEVPAGVQTFPVLGGLTLELPEDTYVWQDGNCMTIAATTESEHPHSPEVVIALASVFGVNSPEPLTSTEELLAIAADTFSITENGQTISAIGQELVGYDLRDETKEHGPPIPEHSFSCAAQDDVGSNASLFPGPVATTYLAPYDGGVLVISADGWDEADMAAAIELLDLVVPTMSIEG